MLSFRKKIALSTIIIFIIFIVVLFPVTKQMAMDTLRAPLANVAKNLRVSFFSFGVLILLGYSLVVGAILYRLSKPIEQIFNMLKPYQEGKEQFPPHIEINRQDDFGKLAKTLNFLSKQVKKQIKILIHQKNETESILEALSEGIIAVDDNKRITFINKTACKMLEKNKEALLDEKLSDIGTSKILEVCKALIFLSKEKKHIMQKEIKENSSYINIIAKPNSHKEGVLLVLQDKTSDYKMVEMGKDFIANASHELKTPITIITGFAETLYEHPDLSKEIIKEVTSKIMRTSNRLTNLLKNLLMLSDLERIEKEKFLKCDLYSLAQNCKMQLLSSYKNIMVSIEKPDSDFYVSAEISLLERAVMNILENAVKYSEKSPEIYISFKIIKDQITLSIKDNGVGIPIKDQPYIFDRFYTVDKARARKYGGAGLGLSIVKTIMEKHQGRVGVVSDENGSVFSISIPRFIKKVIN